MGKKPAPPRTATKEPGERLLDHQVQVSESGQFTVSIDAVRKLPSFRRDVSNVAQIREKLQSRR